MTQGVVYEVTCQRCLQMEKETKYYGESARCSYDRGVEHLRAPDKLDAESPLAEHHQEDHGGETPMFQMKVVSYHSRPLSRQIEEAHLIDNFRGHKIMNRKGEWGQNLPPKLTIEGTETSKQTKRKRARHLNPGEGEENHQAPQDLHLHHHDPPQTEAVPAPKRRRTKQLVPAHEDNRPKSKHLNAKQILTELWKRRPERKFEPSNTENKQRSATQSEVLSQPMQDQALQLQIPAEPLNLGLVPGDENKQ